MAHISYVNPADVEDPEIQRWLEESIEKGWPDPEPLHILAHDPILVRSDMRYWWAMRNEGVLDYELMELIRVRVAMTWERKFKGTGRHYEAESGTALEVDNPESRLSELEHYEESDKFTPREKLALRYCDAIMWDPARADDAMWAQLHEEFNERELVELISNIGRRVSDGLWIMTLEVKPGELQEAIGRPVAQRAGIWS